jgi:hypothetical protein
MELAAILGGVTGLLGTGLTYVMDYFKHKQDAKARAEEAGANLAIANIELEKVKLLAASNITQLVQQGDNAIGLAAYEADKASYVQETANAPKLIKYMLGFVDFLRGLIRPGTTIGYGGLLAWLVVIAVSTLGAKEFASAHAEKLVDAAIYLATTTTLWWFGVRPMSKK